MPRRSLRRCRTRWFASASRRPQDVRGYGADVADDDRAGETDAGVDSLRGQGDGAQDRAPGLIRRADEAELGAQLTYRVAECADGRRQRRGDLLLVVDRPDRPADQAAAALRRSAHLVDTVLVEQDRLPPVPSDWGEADPSRAPLSASPRRSRSAACATSAP